MERIFLLCVTCFCIFFVLPTVVLGESSLSTDSSNGKEESKSSSVLFSNWKKVDNVLKDTTKTIDVVEQETVKSNEKTVTETVAFTEQSISDLSKPLESNLVISRLEATGNLLNKSVENSVPTIEKTLETVTETVVKTTSEVTNAVNDTVDSVVYELPNVPVLTPVVSEVSKTVRQTTSSVNGLVEKTGKFVNENENSINNISQDGVVENSNTLYSEDKIIPPHEIIQNDEKTIIMDGKFDSNPTSHSCDVCIAPNLESVIPSLPAEGMGKQDGTSDLEEHNDVIEIVINEEDNLVVDSISGENSIDRHMVVQEISVIEQVINSKTAYNHNYPLVPNQEWSGGLPSAIISIASPSAASPTLSTGGQSDSFFGAIVDGFTLISSNSRQWIHTDEHTMFQWTHAPPGKPPQLSPFLKCEMNII